MQYAAEELRKEIEAETMRHTQKRGTIVSPVPITLRIVSPHLPGLSMVDMPGLTKVPIDGQPKSIVQVGAGARLGMGRAG